MKTASEIIATLKSWNANQAEIRVKLMLDLLNKA